MIEKKEVKHIANLAHLKLSNEEINLFTRQLGDILDYINKLNEIDTDEITPTAYNIPMKNVLREDKVKESMDREKVLTNAPEKKDGQFRVPKIISED